MGSQQGDIKTENPSEGVKQEVNTPTQGDRGNHQNEQRGGGGGGGGMGKKRTRGGRWQGNRNSGGGGGGGGGGVGGGGGADGRGHFNNSDQGSGGNQNRDGDQDMMMDNKRGGGRGSGGRFGGGPGNRDREFERINEKVMQISGPTLELPPLDNTEKKFAGRNRLYVGNLTSDITEDDITELFKPYGETSELFLNKEKMFAFIRLDYHANAERAKRELDGQMRKGRPLKIRFAPNASSVRVKNLTPYVTNELLYAAFSVFGDIERCVVIVDERGKSTCEGIVEFARKPAALCAIRRCSENCFFLTSSLRPVIVEQYDILDDIDGFSEKGLTQKKTNDWYKAREVGPRFASPNSFEHEYGTRWKQLCEIYKQKFEALKREQAMEEDKLEAQMEYARYEHETEMLREQLRARELDKERQKREWEMKERAVEEERQQREEQMRRMQEEMLSRMNHQEEDLRRRQEENSLFLKAHQLTNMLEQQERYDTTVISGNNDAGNNIPMDPKSFMDAYDRGNDRMVSGGEMGRGDDRMGGGHMDNRFMDNRMDNRMGGGSGGGGGGSGSGGRGYDNDMRGNRGGNWGNIGGRRDDNYQNKRRRY